MTSGDEQAHDSRAAIQIEHVRIRNFRALPDINFSLSPSTTVLVGENNAGKSSILQALAVAFGTRRAESDDFYVAPDGKRSETFTVDISVIPSSNDSFEDNLGALIGNSIRRQPSGREVFSFQVAGSLAGDRVNVDLRRSFTERWNGTSTEAEPEPLSEPRFTDRHQSLMSFALLDASRDLVGQLRQRSSQWGRLLAQLDLPEETKQAVVETLSGVGDKLINDSSVLKNVSEELQRVRDSLPTVSDVKLEPIPVKVEELARNVDISVAGPGAASLPLRFQGLGSRGLAELMVFKAFTSALVGIEQVVKPHIISCFEEPEAHLHPQAQIATSTLVHSLPGQKLLTTHSAHILSECDLRSVRFIRRTSTTVEVRQSSDLPDSDLIKVRRLAERPYGQVLFARAVIIADGATERAALPVLAHGYWGAELEGKCVSVVDPGSLEAAGPLIQLLDDLRIPWFVLGDNDKAGKNALGIYSNRLGRTVDTTSNEIVCLPEGMDFEKYLRSEGYAPEVKAAIEQLYGTDALTNFQQSKQGYAKLSEEDLVFKFLDKSKGAYGQAVAESIVASTQRPNIPPIIDTLFHRVNQVL